MNENSRQRDWSYHVCCMIVAGIALACGCFLAAVVCVVGSTVVILIHELAHAAVARLVGIRIKRIRVWPWHGYTELDATDEECLTLRFAAVAVAGPLAGLVAAAIAHVAATQLALPGVLADSLRLLSLALCGDTVINLLPVWRFDGKFAANALAAVWQAARTRAKAAAQASYLIDEAAPHCRRMRWIPRRAASETGLALSGRLCDTGVFPDVGAR